MPVQSRIRSTCRSMLLSIPNLPVVAWEGRKFDVDAQVAKGDPYIVENLTVAGSRVNTLGTGGEVLDTIIYSLALYQPVTGDTLFEIEDLADLIVYKFHPGTYISDGKVSGGSVERSYRSGVKQNQNWLRLTVSIQFPVRRPTHIEPT